MDNLRRESAGRAGAKHNKLQSLESGREVCGRTGNSMLIDCIFPRSQELRTLLPSSGSNSENDNRDIMITSLHKNSLLYHFAF